MKNISYDYFLEKKKKLQHFFKGKHNMNFDFDTNNFFPGISAHLVHYIDDDGVDTRDVKLTLGGGLGVHTQVVGHDEHRAFLYGRHLENNHRMHA